MHARKPRARRHAVDGIDLHATRIEKRPKRVDELKPLNFFVIATGSRKEQYRRTKVPPARNAGGSGKAAGAPDVDVLLHLEFYCAEDESIRPALFKLFSGVHHILWRVAMRY